MKRFTAFALALLFLLTLTACGEKEPSNGPFENFTLPTAGTSEPTETSAPAQTEEPPENPTEEEPPMDVEELVYDSYSDAGEYEFDFGYGETSILYYSYHLPAIDAQSDGALAINRDIRDTFGTLVDDQYKTMGEGSYPLYNMVSWYPSCYRDLVVLLIVAESNFDTPAYGVYCYNQTTGEWLQNSELLDYLYIAEDEFLKATREAAEEFFVSNNEGVSEEEREMYGYDDCLEWTVSDENINLDNLMFYPDEQGELIVIARIGSMAGAAWYYHCIYPEIAYG